MTSIQDNESGFTLIEALTAVLIITILTVPIYRTVSETTGYKEKIRGRYMFESSRLIFYSSLRKAVMNIEFPFWESCGTYVSHDGKGIVSIPYWKGEKEMEVVLSLNGDILEYSSPWRRNRIKGVKSFKVAPMTTSWGAAAGIKLTVKYRQNISDVLTCPFGAIGTSVFRNVK